MAVLTLRTSTRAGDTTKGLPLTSAEIDQNFINIDSELELKAPINNPTFTGTVTLPDANISGGAMDGVAIGFNVRSTGAFTTFTANDVVTLTKGTNSTSPTTGTLIVTGGIGVSGAVYAANANVTGTVTAATFTGSGSGLTAVPAASLTGTVDSARLTGTYSIDVSGNAATVTNGVYSNGSYANPSWITSLDISKVTNGVSLAGAQTLTNKTLDKPVWIRDVVTIGANHTGVRGKTYVFIASLDFTLPLNPTSGDSIELIDRSGTTTSRVLRNGQNIMGLAEDYNVDIPNFSKTFIFVDATRGWVTL